MVVLTGVTGSLMVIAVNGFMNRPTGFRLENGKAVDVDPWSALFANSYFWHELVHMYLAGYIVVGFAVAGVYAWGALRGRWGRYERTALAVPFRIQTRLNRSREPGCAGEHLGRNLAEGGAYWQ